MTLDKAIEILTREVNDITLPADPDVPDAIKLGISALQVIQSMRKGSVVPIHVPLPGETEK